MKMKKCSLLFLLLATGIIISAPAFSQFPSDSTNIIESEVIPYILPDPLLMPNGERVKNAEQWMEFQRPYIYYLFEKNVYGRYPRKPIPIRYRIREYSDEAFGGIATRKQIRIYLKPSDTTVHIDVLMYLPKDTKKPAPVFFRIQLQGQCNRKFRPEHNIVG